MFNGCRQSFNLLLLKMACKHAKDRKIPKAFKKMEDRVILWVHVFELIVILFAAAVTVSVALFLKSNVETPMVNEDVTPVETVEEVEDKTTIETTDKDEEKKEKELNVWPASK